MLKAPCRPRSLRAVAARPCSRSRCNASWRSRRRPSRRRWMGCSTSWWPNARSSSSACRRQPPRPPTWRPVQVQCRRLRARLSAQRCSRPPRRLPARRPRRRRIRPRARRRSSPRKSVRRWCCTRQRKWPRFRRKRSRRRSRGRRPRRRYVHPRGRAHGSVARR